MSGAAPSTVVVVGDVLLDVDLVGEVERVCPDAPVPVVDLVEERERAGGAGLAASMLVEDGTQVRLVTALAEDDAADRLRAALSGVDLIAGRSSAPTPVKSRVRAGGQSLLRVDQGSGSRVPPAVDDMMLDAVAGADAILVCDYGRGLTADPRLRDVLRRMATRVPVVWDPHPRGAAPVAGCRLVTPNLAEARGFSGVEAGFGVGAAADVADRLRQLWSVAGVVVTLGARGAVLQQGAVPVVVPAPPVPVVDPCGAGDRFAATATVRLMAGRSADEAVRDAVAAASAYVSGRSGPTGSSPGFGQDASEVAARVRARGGTVVASGGCFDLLHAGHARMLAAARSLGDCLIVCVNSDSSVRRLKGPDRPITSEADRIELLGSLQCVDAVAVFDEDTPARLLDELRPDLWVKGGDYSVATLPEAPVLSSWGGRAVVVPYHANRSTSRLVSALAAAD